MKKLNLNLYGKKFINDVLNYGRWEDEDIYKQVDYISVTESNTNFLINIEIVEHAETKYLYNGIKYVYNSYKKYICNEIFTISKRLSEEEKEELLENFCDNFYSNYYEFEEEEITEDEYYSSNDFSLFEIKQKIEDKIL